MLKFVKGDDVKFIDQDSTLIQILKDGGWVVEGEPKAEEGDDERELLKAQAEALGIKVHHKAGADKIRALIEEAHGDSE